MESLLDFYLWNFLIVFTVVNMLCEFISYLSLPERLGLWGGLTYVFLVCFVSKLIVSMKASWNAVSARRLSLCDRFHTHWEIQASVSSSSVNCRSRSCYKMRNEQRYHSLDWTGYIIHVNGNAHQISKMSCEQYFRASNIASLDEKKNNK